MSSSDPEDPTDRSGRSGGERAESGDGRPSDSPVARRAELPPDVDAAFAGIVADWASAGAPRWPNTDAVAGDREADRDARRRSDDDGPSSGVGTATPPRGWNRDDPPAGPAPRGRADDVVGPPGAPELPPPAAHRPYPTPPPDDENFVPPEPPPLPRVRAGAVLGLLLLVFGVVLLAVPGLTGASFGLGLVPGLLAMAAGLGWLVIGLRRTHDDDSDDGAVV